MSKYVCAKCGKEEVREGTAEEVKSCCGQTMVKKEEYIDKLSVQLKDWGVQIDKLKEKAAKGPAEMKAVLDKDMVILNKMMKDAQQKLRELKGKTGPAWQAFAEGANKAWNDLGEGVRKAGEKLK